MLLVRLLLGIGRSRRPPPRPRGWDVGQELRELRRDGRRRERRRVLRYQPRPLCVRALGVRALGVLRVGLSARCQRRISAGLLLWRRPATFPVPRRSLGRSWDHRWDRGLEPLPAVVFDASDDLLGPRVRLAARLVQSRQRPNPPPPLLPPRLLGRSQPQRRRPFLGLPQPLRSLQRGRRRGSPRLELRPRLRRPFPGLPPPLRRL
mmetsp:Transcript_39009/g.87224  ORF Transcript_39009/g.87224 Transcript_39009/m.87224 type:complete len:206 (+) Transcript_39009:401-1018(+)